MDMKYILLNLKLLSWAANFGYWPHMISRENPRHPLPRVIQSENISLSWQACALRVCVYSSICFCNIQRVEEAMFLIHEV